VRIPFQSTSLSRAWTLLTGHIGQTLLSIFLFYGFGFALFGRLERYELALLSLGVGLLLIIFSRVWLTRFRLGPLEWVWRSLIYGAGQPLRRSDAKAGAIG